MSIVTTTDLVDTLGRTVPSNSKFTIVDVVPSEFSISRSNQVEHIPKTCFYKSSITVRSDVGYTGCLNRCVQSVKILNNGVVVVFYDVLTTFEFIYTVTERAEIKTSFVFEVKSTSGRWRTLDDVDSYRLSTSMNNKTKINLADGFTIDLVNMNVVETSCEIRYSKK